jgi:hypothetical protein
MTTPTQPDFSHLDLNATPSTENIGETTEDFGPDVNAAPPPFENIPVGTAAPPRDKRKRPRGTVFSRKSGEPVATTPKAKIPQSSVRALTQADQDKIAEYYVYLAMGVAPFRMATAQAITEQSDACAAAWMEMARKNVKVRKMIVGALEGGATGKLIFAHLPILISITPMDGIQKLMPKMFEVLDRLRNTYHTEETQAA